MKIENQQFFLDFLNRNFNRPCPICNHLKWNVSDTVFELREFNKGDMIIGGNSSISPVVPLTCSNCGNMVMINAIVAGALSITEEGEK